MTEAATPASNFAGFVNVWARDLQVGMRSNGKSRITAVTVHEDGSADVKWNNSPRICNYAATRYVGILAAD